MSFPLLGVLASVRLMELLSCTQRLGPITARDPDPTAINKGEGAIKFSSETLYYSTTPRWRVCPGLLFPTCQQTVVRSTKKKRQDRPCSETPTTGFCSCLCWRRQTAVSLRAVVFMRTVWKVGPGWWMEDWGSRGGWPTCALLSFCCYSMLSKAFCCFFFPLESSAGFLCRWHSGVQGRRAETGWQGTTVSRETWRVHIVVFQKVVEKFKAAGFGEQSSTQLHTHQATPIHLYQVLATFFVCSTVALQSQMRHVFDSKTNNKRCFL